MVDGSGYRFAGRKALPISEETRSQNDHCEKCERDTHVFMTGLHKQFVDVWEGQTHNEHDNETAADPKERDHFLPF